MGKDNIFVVGVGITQFGQHTDDSIANLVKKSVSSALKDAGTGSDLLDHIYYSASTTSFLQGQTFVPGQIALRKMGIQGVPIFNVENACASGSSAFNLAVQAVKAETADVALAVGAEKMIVDDKTKMFAVFDGGWDIESVEENKARLFSMGDAITVPPNTTSKKPYSVFMDVYAAFCRMHMKTFGTTQRQIASVCAKNHAHSVHNQNAQFRRSYSVDEVMAAPPITYPLTLPMCAPVSDGSAAAIVCNEAGIQRIGAPRGRSVRVLGSVVQTGTDRHPNDYENHITARAARKLYEQTGMGPSDVDVVEVHDATAMGEIIQVENLQLVPFGEGGPVAERGDFTIGGATPVNPSGGLESRGHPIGATGLAQIHELVTQLRGEAGKRQVEGARIALQENGGGLIGIEEAVAVLNLFSIE